MHVMKRQQYGKERVRYNPTNTTDQTTFQLNTSFIHSVTYRVSVEFSLTMCILQQTAVGCTGASCRLLNFYDAFRDKQASAIVFHIYNLTDRGAELKQSFMGGRGKNVRFMRKKKKKERFSDCFVWSIFHVLGDEGCTHRAPKENRWIGSAAVRSLVAARFSIMQINSRTVMIAI